MVWPLTVTVDTNVLVRAVVRDDKEQARRADSVLREATILAVSVACLCEFVWVLRRSYSFSVEETADAVQRLLEVDKVAANRPAAEAGLALLQAGGDFADGAIAFEGRWLGGETFVSFDSEAVALLQTQGHAARLLE